MSKIYVFTPTCRFGGVDVTHASIARQTEKSVTWVVMDDLADVRHDMWDDLSNQTELIWGVPPLRREGDYRNLAAAYNVGVEIALEDPEAELFVTLQDYIWIPEYGFERMLKIHRGNPNLLISGLCSITADPHPDKVVDPEGHYTIFAEPYKDKPQEIAWEDCRDHPSEFYVTSHQAWEANWGAVPVDLLRRGLRWDREYDRGVAYENQALALDAINYYGAEVLVDCGSHAYSLPHKKYFPQEEARDVSHNNREWHESKWRERGIEP